MKQNNARYVAHFDMLGMTRALYRNPDKAWGALSDLSATKNKINSRRIEVRSTGQKIKNDRVKTVIFSDTVVIFSLSDEQDDLYSILLLSAQFFADALHKCVPLRGGIAHGDFFFNLDLGIFMGEPLVRSHQIGEDAQWLGMVVDSKVACEAKKLPLKDSRGDCVIVEWKVPVKNNEFRKQEVLNWPRIFSRNFKIPVSEIDVSSFYAIFEHLFGPYDLLGDEVKGKYINTVDFIRYQLKDE